MVFLRFISTWGLGKAPLNIFGPGVTDRRDAEGVERAGAIVKEKDIRTGAAGMTRVDPFILAVVNPEAIEQGGHARITSRHDLLNTNGRPAAVHGNPCKWPFLRVAGGPVQAVPAMNIAFLAGAFPRIRPCLSPFRIVPAGRIELVG